MTVGPRHVAITRHVSITGLRLRRSWHAAPFWLLAVAAMAQARRAPGCLSAEARTVDGVHHTLSVWTTRAAMRAWMRGGAHRQAMRLSGWIADGHTLGFAATDAPDWPEAIAIWRARAPAG